MVRQVMLAFRRTWAARRDSTPLAALTAFLLANSMAYLVAFQVYGDPLIGFFVGFALGLLLSASRLTGEEAERLPEPVPDAPSERAM